MEPENQNAPATPETPETAAATATDTAATAKSDRGRQQVKQAKVVSNKMDKTVVVTVENAITHRLYHRYLKRTSRFHAHDEQNECNVGDVVEIVSSRPLSRTKRWRVRRIIKKAE
jgi:small subunit ribosomal protein S17